MAGFGEARVHREGAFEIRAGGFELSECGEGDAAIVDVARVARVQPESAADSTPQDLRVKQADPLTRRPVTPSDEEISRNPRSRSAKLRALRKL